MCGKETDNAIMNVIPSTSMVNTWDSQCVTGDINDDFSRRDRLYYQVSTVPYHDRLMFIQTRGRLLPVYLIMYVL